MNTATDNSSALKIYKELTYIQTFDGELYASCEPQARIEKLENTNKFLNL